MRKVIKGKLYIWLPEDPAALKWECFDYLPLMKASIWVFASSR